MDKKRVSPVQGTESDWPSQLTERALEKTYQEPPTTKKINTDSEEDPEFNEEEFNRLRSSLHRKIDEAEARNRANRDSSKPPCTKLRRFFRRMFDSNTTRRGEEEDQSSKKVESIQTRDLDKLKSPSSPNQVLGDVGPSNSSSDASTID